MPTSVLADFLGSSALPSRYRPVFGSNSQILSRQGRRSNQQSRRLVRPLSASAETEQEAEEVAIEGISRNYCDGFVCTSSPQVEQNLKALARDTTRLSTWTISLFRKDVRYKDAFLSFQGPEGYKRLKWVKDSVKDAKVLVTRLKMLDKGTAQVQWRLRGTLGMFGIDIDFISQFELDLITGRVISHTESWDLQKLSPPARAAFLASRALWTVGVSTANAREAGSKALDNVFGDSDDQQQNISVDPNDPTKFFQQNDDFMKDAFSLSAIAAFLYFIFQAYAQIEKLK